jgi:hypothetical protein
MWSDEHQRVEEMREVGPLLDRLSIAAKALSPQSIVPLLAHFWFLGDGRVVAFNDVQAAEVLTDAKVNAAIPGELLHKILSTFAVASAWSLSRNESNVELKCEGSTIHLPYLPLNDPPFSFPEGPPTDAISCGEDFFNGLRRCLLSTGTKNERFQVRGVTIARSKTGIGLYSTDNVTLSRYEVVTNRIPLIKSPMMLPGQFCEQILTAYAMTGENGPLLKLYPGAVTMEFGEAVKCFSRLDIHATLEFESTVAVYFKPADVKYATKIPPELGNALARLATVSDSAKDKVSLWRFSPNSLVLRNRDVSGGFVEEHIKTKTNVEAEFSIDTALVARALKVTEEMVVVPGGKALALLGNKRRFLHMVAFYG